MPYNGSGAFSAPGASFPAVSGALIESAKYNAVVNDIATGLSTAIAKDGQTTVTANLPMAGYRHTGVGNAVSRTDYAATGQVQDSSTTWAGTAGGTADAITLTLTPAISAYAAGQSFTYKSSASANTGAMTVNINGVGAKAIQKNGVAMAAGDHAASSWFRITYDGTAFQLAQIFQPSAFMLTVMDDATAAAARATLGAFGSVGTTTNDSAAAGDVGEIISSTVASGSAVSLTNVTAKTVTSITLTAGDWDIRGNLKVAGISTTTLTQVQGCSSATTDTFDDANGFSQIFGAHTPGGNFVIGGPIPVRRATIAGTTTYYLVAYCAFSAGTASAYGSISARRIR